MFTPEDAYNFYHSAVLYREKGVYPKRVQNFTKARSRADWIYFERFAALVKRSQGHIDPELYIGALADMFNGRFPAKMLVHPKGMKHYKLVRDQRNVEANPKIVRDGVLHSLQHVVTFMRERDLRTLDDYFDSGSIVIPDVARHLSAGSITRHFLALVPNIESRVRQYAPDVKADYFSNICEWLPRARINAGRDDKLRRLGVRLEATIFSLTSKD